MYVVLFNNNSCLLGPECTELWKLWKSTEAYPYCSLWKQLQRCCCPVFVLDISLWCNLWTEVKARQYFLSDFLSDINHVIAKLPHFWTLAKPRYQLYSCLTDLILQLMQIKQIFIFSGENLWLCHTVNFDSLGLPHIYIILGMQSHFKTADDELKMSWGRTAGQDIYFSC